MLAPGKPTRLQVGIGILTLSLIFILIAFLAVMVLNEIRGNWSLGWSHPSPRSGTMPEEDLASLWMAGHLVRLGKLDWLYTSSLFDLWRHHIFGATLRSQPWIYPPTVLLVGVPLSFLPLVAAYILWDAGTLVIAILLLRHARLPWGILLVGLAAPASWRSMLLGQYGVITGALVVAGLLLAPRYPFRAGIMLGLCTLKPQQAAIVPFAWLAARNWRAFVTAVSVTVVLAVMICGWLGIHAWTMFLTQSHLSMQALLEAPLPQPNISNGISVFWMARTLGFGMPEAYTLQGLSAVVAVIMVYRAWRLPKADPLARMAVTVCLSLLIVPYGYTCDMVAYSIAIAVVVANNGWRIRLIDGLLWLWPGYCQIVDPGQGMVLNPAFITITAAMAWQQMARWQAPQALAID